MFLATSNPLAFGPFFGALGDFIIFIILVVIGILILAMLVGVAIIFLPAIIIAIVVYLLTGSFLFAGIAFLVVALIGLLR
jgi:hypothetical protein